MKSCIKFVDLYALRATEWLTDLLRSSDFYKHNFLLRLICIRQNGKMFPPKQPAFSCADRERVSLCHRPQSFTQGGSVGHDGSGAVPDSPSQEARMPLSGFGPNSQTSLHCQKDSTCHTTSIGTSQIFLPKTCKLGAAHSRWEVNPAVGYTVFDSCVVFKTRTFFFFLQTNLASQENQTTQQHKSQALTCHLGPEA